MKRTVTQWTNIQYALNKMPPDGTLNNQLLIDLIEHRTYGKVWSSNVSIAMDKPTVRRIESAETWLEENPES